MAAAKDNGPVGMINSKRILQAGRPASTNQVTSTSLKFATSIENSYSMEFDLSTR